MRGYRARVGPFARQPYYKPGEIELICVDELRKLNLYPSAPSPVRIDRFVEKRFVPPAYEDLPAGLLGFTRFGPNGVEEVVVAKSLDDEGTKPSERRLRATLAHEAGHGLLHAHLFAFGARPDSLFRDELAEDTPKILCRDGGISGVGMTKNLPRYRWWEFQANQVIGALLLPKELVEEALARLLRVQGAFGIPALPEDRREHATRHCAETFDVNPVVARIRLSALYPPTSGQLTF